MNLKRVFLAFISAIALFQSTAVAQDEVSGVYIGGHIRRERPGTITKLKHSGFTYALLFNVHVDTDGTLMTDGETICKDGKYVFGNTQPHYQEDIKALKTAPTSITRVEIVIGGWGNDSYDHIRDLINSKGTGSTTMLYKNFKALKEAVPEIDAVNNDDEHCYDLTTGAKFHIMMYDLGYQTTLAPYMNKSYWQNLCKQIRASRKNAVDRVMVQCYDGGAGNVNDVKNWTFDGVTNIHAGLLNYSNDWSVEKNMAQFESWRDNHGVKGGFVWVYNDESWNLNAWGAGMNQVYGAKKCSDEEAMVELFSEYDYKGYSVKLPEGTFTQGDLAAYGLTAKDLSSIKVLREGVKIKIYKSIDCTGAYYPYKKDVTKLSSAYNNLVCSIVVEYTEPDPCAAPVIAYADGKLTFNSATTGAKCTYTIEAEDATTATATEVELKTTYHVSAYATATGYSQSPTTEATLFFQPLSSEEGDGVFTIKTKPIIVTTDGGAVKVRGYEEGTTVTLSTTDGKLLGSAKVISGTATIYTDAQPGTVVILNGRKIRL